MRDKRNSSSSHRFNVVSEAELRSNQHRHPVMKLCSSIHLIFTRSAFLTTAESLKINTRIPQRMNPTGTSNLKRHREAEINKVL